jgi:hypothetical protein
MSHEPIDTHLPTNPYDQPTPAPTPLADHAEFVAAAIALAKATDAILRIMRTMEVWVPNRTACQLALSRFQRALERVDI